MMTALCERRTPAWLSARSNPGSERPPRANPPILRKSRRVTPSQYPVRAGPKRLNMPLALPSCPAEHPSLCRCLTRLCTPFPGLANPAARRSIFVNFVLVGCYLSATSRCPAPTPLVGALPNLSGFRGPPSLEEKSSGPMGAAADRVISGGLAAPGSPALFIDRNRVGLSSERDRRGPRTRPARSRPSRRRDPAATHRARVNAPSEPPRVPIGSSLATSSTRNDEREFTKIKACARIPRCDGSGRPAGLSTSTFSLTAR